ncbi:polysaccharide biosynthesis/export protein [Gammaproteobacteria bacterium]
MKVSRNHYTTYRGPWWLVCLVTLYLAILAVPVAVQALTLTPEQRELFNQLSPEQQTAATAALQQKGISTSGSQSSQSTGIYPSGSPPSPPSQPEITPPVVIPRSLDSSKSSPIEKEAEAPKRAPDVKEQKPQAEPEKLKQFGYDLFAGTPTTFAPATDIPVPTDYVIGPGDTIQVQLFGKDNQTYSLIVSRDGEISFPAIGPISVAGMKFSEVRENLMDRVAHQTRGNTANVTMGPLRSIRVLVLGEAQQPGSYTISSLSTLTNALLLSGGVKPIGSLRNIQLKRNGKTVAILDLYDLLLRGDTSGDVRLAPGDVLFIPTIGTTVGVAGAVNRPAIYELKGEKDIADAIRLAGGALPGAYLQGGQLERIHEGQDHTVLNLDLRTPKAMATPVKNGDVVRVYSVLDRFDGTVTLTGHVHRPGQVQWHRGMRLTDLIRSAKELLPRPDTSYVVVRRELPDRHMEALTVDLGQALAHPKSTHNIELAPADEVRVFGLDENRADLLSPLITQLRQQTRNQTEPVVTIQGQVRYPSTYPLTRGMRLMELVAAAGGTLPDVELDFAVIRREIDKGQHIEVLSTGLREAMAAPGGSADLPLNPRDQVHLFSLTEDRAVFLNPLLTELRRQALTNEEAPIVEVSGSVLNPGSYPLNHGMRVSDLLRVVNLSDSAYTLTAEITRYAVVNAISRETDHLNVDLAAILNGNQNADILLKPYDRLAIRPIPKWGEQETVEVKGEVNFPGIYSISRGETLSSLLRRAGGLTANAFPQGAVFVRKKLKEREQEQIDALATRMEQDIAAAQLVRTENPTAGEGAQQQQSVLIARQLAQQLRNTKAVGRLVIDLPTLFAGPQIAGVNERRYAELDVVLKGGDRLMVPRDTQEITVIGEVHHPTSFLYEEGLDRDDYISKSGGMTSKADKGEIFIVQASGNVVANDAGRFFGWLPVGERRTIQPGDTIVVPLEAERIRSLSFWSEITKIMYQIALSAAAMKTVGAL